MCGGLGLYHLHHDEGGDHTGGGVLQGVESVHCHLCNIQGPLSFTLSPAVSFYLYLLYTNSQFTIHTLPFSAYKLYSHYLITPFQFRPFFSSALLIFALFISPICPFIHSNTLFIHVSSPPPLPFPSTLISSLYLPYSFALCLLLSSLMIPSALFIFYPLSPSALTCPLCPSISATSQLSPT